MARCGCTSGCACLLHHLDTNCVDVTITGSGSSIDPYVISAELDFDLDPGNLLTCSINGLLAKVFMQVAPNSCMTVTGSGTSLDPFVFTTTAFQDDIATFAISGPLSAPTLGTLRFRFPFDATLLGVSAAVNTAPTGANIVLDVNKNGVSIFPISTKPTITAGTFDTGGSEDVPDTTSVSSGQYLQVDIDQVGSIVAGSDLTVFIHYTRPIVCTSGL